VALAADLPPAHPDPDGEHVFTDEVLDDFDEWPIRGSLTSVAGVRFQPGGKVYDVDAGDQHYRRGERVLVDSERGQAVAVIADEPVRRLAVDVSRRIVRRADVRDLARVAEIERKGEEILRVARDRVRERRMPIKMFKVEMLPGGNKAVLYFSSDDRIDFRDLARELSQRVPIRLEIRQTGVRDEAKAVGGIGSCGRELCCTTFLPRFDPVSIKMAKDQGLVLNPSKVSGQCGRLKCCLVYEQAMYSEMRKGLPKLGKRVTTPAGEGRVSEVDVLRRRIRVSFGPGEFQTFPAEAVTPMFPPQLAPGARRSLPVVDQGAGPGDDSDDAESDDDRADDSDDPRALAGQGPAPGAPAPAGAAPPRHHAGDAEPDGDAEPEDADAPDPDVLADAGDPGAPGPAGPSGLGPAGRGPGPGDDPTR
jgi:cell fate regulator YaaT (PSP1 superfamily)